MMHAQISGLSTISASALKNSMQIVRTRKIVLFWPYSGTMTVASQNPILASLTNQMCIWYLKKSMVIISIHLINQIKIARYNAAIACVTRYIYQVLLY